jgi:hypothetical protein
MIKKPYREVWVESILTVIVTNFDGRVADERKDH